MTTSVRSIIPHTKPLERAIEDVAATSLQRINPEIIKTLWDPDAIPAELFSVLAHALSVDLWDDSWSELKKRSVLRRWVNLEFSKGTYAGYRDFIEIAGGSLEEIVVPPGGTFAAPALSKDEMERWVDLHPRVIVKLVKRTGLYTHRAGIFASASFTGFDCATPSDAHVLRARRAVYRENKNAPDQDIQVARITTEDTTRVASVTERLILPAKKPRSTFAGLAWAGYSITEAPTIGRRCYSFALSRNYRHVDSDIWLDRVPVGLQPRDTRYYRVSDIGDGTGATFATASWASRRFSLPNNAAELLGDVLYLHNPEIASPRVKATSFAGYTRIAVRRFHAEFRVKLNTKLKGVEAVSGHAFVGRGIAMPTDLTARNSALRAIQAARAKRDKILVTFQNNRLRTLSAGFYLGDGAALGGNVRNTL